MNEHYCQTIAQLIEAAPFNIDTNITIAGRIPPASSEFLTNREQGDWAERIILSAINENTSDFIAIKYGRSDSLAAGDSGFADFYLAYQDELNHIGKKPDILIFRKSDIPDPYNVNLDDEKIVSIAVAAIEVRSSSFLAQKYALFMRERTRIAEQECARICEIILQEPLATTLQQKSPDIFNLIQSANTNTFRELDFRLRSWSSSETLRQLSEQLKALKEQIKILHKRDFLSITPKIEDLALVNRWIQKFGVPHYYLQVFFDKAYVISFREILEISSDSSKEDVVFSIERDVKNQGKTTIKINIQVGREIIGKIDEPEHKSARRELERGRLLFYVTFEGGKGYLDSDVFLREIVNND
ncbi:MAG: AccI family restriction endonuclease [Merismopediaceae bacterium]|nr:AccI family restriction endonuclease [Merismopediaceae bacterium]